MVTPVPSQTKAVSARAWLPGFVALALIWGASFLFIKVGVSELHPLYVTLGRPPSPTDLSADVVLSILALGALGTGLAFVLNTRNIRLAGASAASTVTYVIPVVATIVGVLVLDERLAWYQPVGAAIVLAGVAVSQGAFRRRSPIDVAAAPVRPTDESVEPRVACEAAAIDTRDARSPELGPATRN